MEGKRPSISGLTTNAALTAVKNKIPDVSNLVKKTDYAEILDIKSKFFTTADYNRFSNEKLDLKIKQKQLVNKSHISGFIDNSNFNNIVATLAIKAKLKSRQDEKQNQKHLIQVILNVKIILKMMVDKLFNTSASGQIFLKNC